MTPGAHSKTRTGGFLTGHEFVRPDVPADLCTCSPSPGGPHSVICPAATLPYVEPGVPGYPVPGDLPGVPLPPLDDDEGGRRGD